MTRVIRNIKKTWDTKQDSNALFEYYKQEYKNARFFEGFWHITRFVYMLTQKPERNKFWLDLFNEHREGNRSFMDAEELRLFDKLPAEFKCYSLCDQWELRMDYFISKPAAEMAYEFRKKLGHDCVLVERTVKMDQVFAYVRVGQFDLIIVADEDWLNDNTDFITSKYFKNE